MVMVDVPPGLIYLWRRSPQILGPPSSIYILSRITKAFFGFELTGNFLYLAYALSFPLVLACFVLYTDHVHNRNAATCSAVLPPTTKELLPGGLKMLLKSVRDFKSGCAGIELAQLCREVGNTFNIRILFQNQMFTCEPECIKAILATQFDNWEKGEEYGALMRSVLGTGVFNSDGDMWKFHRSMTRPFFSKGRVTHFEIFARHSDDAIKQLKARLNESYPVDFQDLVHRFTMDSSTEFLFGHDVCSLSAGLPYPHYSPLSRSSDASKHPANVFASAFAQALRIIALRTRYGENWPLLEFWADETKKHMAIVHEFIEPIVEGALAKRKDRGISQDIKEPLEGQTLLEYLVQYTVDKTIIRDEVLNIMIAGRDTTASSMTFATYMLARHPEVLRRLRKEILETVGPLKRPTYDDLRGMRYLRAVINETLRLYPPVPFNARSSKDAAVWPAKNPNEKGYYIPPNTLTPYSVLVMHRRKDLWGPDALEFDPDRFLDDRAQKYLRANPFIFLPFNAGPRICLGQQFAYHEVSFLLVRLLQTFSSISLASEAQPPSTRVPESWAKEGGFKAREKVCTEIHLTMSVAGGLWVTMKEADEKDDTTM